MKEEHKKALENEEVLVSPTGRLSWYNHQGYFNCYDPDCRSCEDFPLAWDEVLNYYDRWEEDEWEVE